MLRSRALNRFMARLALVAMLLLLALPTMGRLAERNDGVDSALAAICTLGGLKYVGLDHWRAGSALQAPAPAKTDPAGMDCAYCLLLGSVAVFAVLLGLLPLLFARTVGTSAVAPVRLAVFQHPCGLGSRGPPIAI